MEKKVIYRDYLLQEFCWWSYNDRGKQEFIPAVAAIRQINSGQAIMVDTLEAAEQLERMKG